MDNNNLNETTLAQIPEQNVEKKKTNYALIIVIVLIVLLIGVGIYFLLFRKVSKKQVIDGTINNVFSNAEIYSKKLENTLALDYKNEIIGSEGLLKVSVDSDDQQVLNNLNGINSLTLNYNMNIDVRNLKGNIDLQFLENKDEVTYLKILLNDKNLYFKTNLIDEVFKYDTAELIDWDSIDVDKLPDVKVNSFSKLLDKMKTYLKNSIKDEYLEQQEVEETIDGTTIKGLKTTLLLNESNIKEILKSILYDAKNDDEFVDILSSIVFEEKDKMKQSLNEAYDSLINGDSTYNLPEYKLNIYTTKTGKGLGATITEGDNKLITSVKNDNITTIKAYTNNKEILKIEYNEKEKEYVWKNESDSTNQTIKKVTVKVLDNGLKTIIEGEKFTIALEGTNDINTEYIKNDYLMDTKLYNDNGNTNIKAEFTNTTKKANSIKDFSVSNAKDIETLTEEDIEDYIDQSREKLNNTIIGRYIITAIYTSRQQKTINNIRYDDPDCIYCGDDINY